jgi:hypothetical protein
MHHRSMLPCWSTFTAFTIPSPFCKDGSLAGRSPAGPRYKGGFEDNSWPDARNGGRRVLWS